ncbi:MAG: hypothetical protein QME90_02435 [Thermodesulfobacteriota bacterium]|nr:hypothetical protein [Thermodesulfobacteriota bacterium]
MLLLFSVGILPCGLSAAIAAKESYYQGKTITIVVGYGAGGGADMFSRLMSRHLGRFLPGNPNLVVRNMSGGDGLIAANYAYKSAKPNGLTVFTSSGGNTGANYLRPKGTEHYLEKMIPVISTSQGSVLVVKPNIGIKEPKDLYTCTELIFGGTGPVGGSEAHFFWAFQFMGLQLKKGVYGYESSGAARMGFFSGELNTNAATTISYNNTLKAYVQRGEALPVCQSGLVDASGNIVREPAAPDVPTYPELYQQVKGNAPSGIAWEAYKLVLAGSTYDKTLLLPPATPEEIVDIWRKAVLEMVKDPKFRKDADLINPGAPLVVGDALVRGYPKAVSGPPDLIQHMKKTLSEKTGAL